MSDLKRQMKTQMRILKIDSHSAISLTRGAANISSLVVICGVGLAFLDKYYNTTIDKSELVNFASLCFVILGIGVPYLFANYSLNAIIKTAGQLMQEAERTYTVNPHLLKGNINKATVVEHATIRDEGIYPYMESTFTHSISIAAFASLKEMLAPFFICLILSFFYFT